ncbi:MAG TPA: Ig-like domain-containing protein [Gemmatimonadaceae bacterium]|nr:Ig-like domain-containing protein [Gemmatimonadaceae bacterium]
MRTDLALLLAMLPATLIGCLEPLNSGDVEVAHVQVAIGSAGAPADTIQVRGTTRVRAIAYAPDGFDTGIADFRYASSDTLIAVVDSAGIVSGVSPGEAIITATAPRGESGSARVVVRPSTIAYTIDVGPEPGAIAFSNDFARGYVLTAPDTLVVLDALGFFRLGAIGLGLAAHGVAATTSQIYVTHPFDDSVSVVSPATHQRTGRIRIGAGPSGIVAAGARAFVAARADRRIVTVEDGAASGAIDVDGEPVELAISGDGRRLFATMRRGGAWHLLLADPQAGVAVSSVAVTGEPTAIATNADGSRVWVLFAGPRRVDAWTIAPGGEWASAGSATVGTGAAGIGARQVGTPYVIVSGEPATVIHGQTMAVVDRVAGGGAGRVAVRPDGLFAFLGVRSSGRVHVLAM